MTFTENEMRQVSLLCMGYMAGMFEEINKNMNPDVKWLVEPDHIRTKAVEYMNQMVKELKESKMIPNE